MKGVVTAVVILVIIVLGYALFATNKSSNTQTPTNSSVTTPNETPVFNKQTIQLNPVGGHTGAGTAAREIDSNSIFKHSVDVTLAELPSGKFYEGWLVRGKMGDSNFAFFSTGKLEKGNDGRWRTSYESPTSYLDYKTVVITLETAANGLDGKPEEHVLEGSF